jgi:hypothetical protein
MEIAAATAFATAFATSRGGLSRSDRALGCALTSDLALGCTLANSSSSFSELLLEESLSSHCPQMDQCPLPNCGFRRRIFKKKKS